MSNTVSLRLCCIAAMAPALTESTSQSRVQLPGSPPPVVSENPVQVQKPSSKNLSSTDIASVKAKISRSLSSELQNTARGLLKPIQGNIDTAQVILTEQIQKSLQDLGLPPNFPDILKQLTAVKSEVNNKIDNHLRACDKKMNQPSPEIGSNGTDLHVIKQNPVVKENTLNGHSSKHNDLTKRVNYTHSNLIYSKVPDSQNTALDLSKTSKMCLNIGTATAQQTVAHPSTSREQHSASLHVNSGVKTRVVSEETSNEVKPADLKEITRKEYLLERRSQFLLRRLRRLQGKHLESHVKLQLKAFVDFQHHNLQSAASKAIRPFGDLPNTLFNSSEVKNLSTSNLVTLVRKLQASQPKHNFESNKKSDARKSVLVMEQSVSSESERKSGHLRRNLRHWNDIVDSDVTESSSGGESCEEWEDCPLMSDKKVPTPLYKRAEWKWSVDRAAIVARWTWLQAQVSDLEYRIRQQSEIYKTIRTSKGVVTLSDPPLSVGPSGDAGSKRAQEMSPANVATLMINVNKQASRLSQSLGNSLSPAPAAGLGTLNKDSSKSLNGIVDVSHQDSSSSAHSQQSCTPVNGKALSDCSSANMSPVLGQPLDASCVSARCRPVRFYRKRKLLHTAGLHQVNHKAARLSSVKCQCYPPVMPCPMCGGRYNNVQKLDAECMPIMEKVSLLDPAFHPVLSFPQEIALPLHFEALLKSGEWQSSKSQPKVTMRAMAAEKRRQKLLNAQIKEQSRKNNRKKYNKTAAAVLLTSAKLRSKYDGKSPHKKSKKVTAETRMRRKELKRRRAAQLAVALKKSMINQDTDMDSLSTLSQTPTHSPQMKDGTLSHSASSSALKDQKEHRKKRFENAYDINNIVIPYSMAASTRVEKLQYKEIQTPKWRELGQSEQDTEEPQAEQEVEDMTDDTFADRHETMEAEERKRFRNFITYPPVRRGRLSRESESNTLETFSPECSLNEASFQTDSAGCLSYIHEERRRSGSTSRRSNTFDDSVREYDSYNDYEYMEPWPARQFPIPEDVYEEMKIEQNRVSSTRNTYRRPRTVKVQDDPSMEFISPDFEPLDSATFAASPAPSGTSTSTCDDENDPEWNENRGDRRSSISMKHSKR
ncbi:KAT8 regulatory NSL complex subunit 1-like isoform X2 [Mercenaria mercenaria]|uniref:KAT8 regulatory NSL complex subunit 1-like isoform X2 n=1 Tax=Mercenaria mercenaria TaxID=6596 RepID=UPI00234E7B34|nr:KAT8 regulatory NSL complex subunit 1-like isoform X2 [Mercenaria mercenaria]